MSEFTLEDIKRVIREAISELVENAPWNQEQEAPPPIYLEAQTDPITGGIKVPAIIAHRDSMRSKYSRNSDILKLIKSQPSFYLWRGVHNTDELNREIERNNGQAEAFLATFRGHKRFFSVFDSGIGTGEVIRHTNVVCAYENSIASFSYAEAEVIQIANDLLDLLITRSLGTNYDLDFSPT